MVFWHVFLALHYTVCNSEAKHCPLLPACLSGLPKDWHITVGFAVVYGVEKASLCLWLIGLLHRSAAGLQSGRTPGITLTALIPTVSTSALVWADSIKAATVRRLPCSPWRTTAGPASSASLFHLTGTGPVAAGARRLTVELPTAIWLIHRK